MSFEEKPDEPAASDHQPQTPNGTDNADPTTKAKEPGPIARFWKASGLSVGQVLIMFKGAIPPVVALAAYQSNAFAIKFATLGYLVAIMALLGFCVMPRAKFFQTMILNILFVCVGAAVALLEMYCSVKARQSTTHVPTGSSAGASGSKQASSYNSSASAVSAVWLFFTIFVANVLRAKRPQLQFPVIIYSIFTVVASLYSPLYMDMAEVYIFINRLLQAFLTGFGIASGVSLFILPTTSRGVVQLQMAGFLKLAAASLGAQRAYLSSVTGFRREDKDKIWDDIETKELSTEAKQMKQLLLDMGAVFGKIDAEASFAKREIAYGKLGPEDFSEMVRLLRDILMPIAGMTTFIDIIQSVKQRAKARKMMESAETIQAIRKFEYEEWSEVMTKSHDSYQELTSTLQGGLQHVAFALEWDKKPKSKDVEATGDMPSPGDKIYAEHLEKTLRTFSEGRKATMQNWCEKKGITLPTTFWDDPKHTISLKDIPSNEQNIRQRQNQQQLYLILYVEYLTWSVGRSILRMIQWADSKVEDGSMKKKTLIVPALKRIRKWATTLFAADADDTEEGFATGTNESANIWVGDSLRARRDPEHLPPTTIFQKATNPLRFVGRFFASPEAAFGFRVACATMSLGIIGFLHQTQDFFVRQRGLWATIMIAISMSSHAGLGIFGFLMRIFGTTIAMCTSLILWYMGGQKTAAILPLLYIFSVPWFYVVMKFPKFAPAAIISMVTPILIIGYELQVRKLGIAASEKTGQPAYPVYELAPYRLLAVCAGLGSAFLFTYFPYPITTRQTLRKQMGAITYLLANYYSCVHTTVGMRLNEDVTKASEEKKGSPAYRLRKARHKVFSKVIILFATATANSNLTRLEPTFGGKFPKEIYDDLIASLRHIFNYIGLISYATNTFLSSDPDEESVWLKDFRRFAGEVNLLSHDITSMLCLLSASIENEHPLPPYLKPPRPYDLDKRMEAIDPELLSISHISEPCYAAFAVLQVASSLITEELETTISLIKQLVGEVDFSFHVISTTDGETKSTGSGSTTVSNEEKERKKD